MGFAVKPIQLLYVENLITRERDGPGRQQLLFAVSVENLAFHKIVEVHWTGEDGYWHSLPATNHGPLGHGRELWRAQVFCYPQGDDNGLPGDVHFALHYRVNGRDYWENNGGRNFSINADSGVRVADEFPLMPIRLESLLQPNQPYLPITVAVRQALHPHRVFVRWTPDHWRTEATTECYFWRQHWDKTHGSSARNPNSYGCAIWISHLHVDDAYRIEYAIGCETPHQKIWNNNEGLNYAARHERLKVLTLNLHCRQEAEQDAKFSQIARAINELNVDLVCFQEVSEPWNDGRGDWSGNAARIIGERLARPYHLHCSYSHRGFGQYLEGSAILSKYPFLQQDATYVSPTQDMESIHARKVPMVQVFIPYMGPVNIFSAHLSWWSGGFRDQFENLRRWAREKHQSHVAATLLCGDFNVSPGSEGYGLATAEGEFVDQFYPARARNTRGARPVPTAAELNADGRIDHVFLKSNSNLQAMAVRELFTESDYGRVSDHTGYYFEFEPY